jgi:menaquinone-specific isochorismate synthase
MEEILSGIFQAPDEQENSYKVLISNGNSPKDRKKWKNMVNRGLEFIDEGKLEKVVLSRKIEISLSNEPSFSKIFRNLENTFPDCGIFLFKKNSSVFFGATPERLFSMNDSRLKIDALAGSAPSSREDALFTGKNIKEHNFVIDYIIKTLTPFTSDILLSRHHDTKKLNNISHIWSEISAVLNDNSHIFLLIKELFPTPAVCGTPRDKALTLIKKLEDHRRGLYAGLIGWLNFSEADFYVSIRSALSNGNKILAFAGCGIVEGSDPEEEFDETELKLIPIVSLFKNENKSQPQYSLG